MADPTYQPKVYHEQGGDRVVAASGGSIDVESGGEIDIETGGALKIAGTDIAAELAASVAGLTATDTEINNAADVSARVQEVLATAGGTIAAGIQSVELNHATVIAAATIADAANHQGLFIVKDTSASGTAAHTLTLTSGTFNGTNNVATLNAPDEALVVYFDSAGNGTVVENVGGVALS